MSSPPTTPQPKKSTFRSRVGGVMRRSSTAFSIPGLPNRSGSATPPPPQDSDIASVSGRLSREGSTTSLDKIDTAPVAAAASTTPSPIPESPAREAAALAAEPAAAPKGPSPLANVTTAQTAPEQSPTPVQAGTPPLPESGAPTAAPQSTISVDEQPAQTVPEGVANKTESPKPEVALLFTSEPDEMPNTQAAPRSAPPSAPASRASTPPPRASAPLSAPRSAPRSAAPSAPVTPAAQPTSTTSYFDDIPRSTTPAGLESDPDTNVWADHGALGGTTSSESSSDVAPERVVTDKPSKSSMRQRGSSVGSSQVISTQPQSRIASRKPSGVLQARQTELAGTTYTWSNSSEMGLGNKTNLPMHDNPFADSKAAAVPEPTNTVVSPTETIHVAEAIDPRSPRDDSMFPAAEPQAVPLHAMYEVMATRAIRQPSSNYFNQSGSESGRYYPPPADESRPLISRPSTPPIITNYPPHTAASQIAQSYRSENPPFNQPVPQWAQPARFDVNGSAQNYSYGSVTRPLVARGWVEFSLPHGLRYYENRDSHAITDIDLRNLARLDEVSVTIETAEVVPEGCEMWIRGTHGGKKGWRKQKATSEPVIFWVDHRSRRVLNEVPSEEYVPSGDDDRLDDEYRYWSFVEIHPAHISRDVVEAARQEAIDALHWSYTDRLLTHPQPVPPPFSQEECQELIKLLNESSHPMTPAYTRIVARVLLRVAHWRQAHFRPYKPLPRDVSYLQHPRSTPIMRTVVEILIGILCLGIPFMFVDRARYNGHFDVEGSHVPESTTPLFVIGACACLVSAIILSASVTLMSLPGLDSIARIGGLVAITCSVLSMVTSFVSIFRYKAEMARGVSQPAGEGFMTLSRRSIMLSLPLVFLAYSVAGFITGVVIYSFRSATINLASAGSPIAAKFDEYTRFMVIGVLGALAGVLIASALVSRR